LAVTSTGFAGYDSSYSDYSEFGDSWPTTKTSIGCRLTSIVTPKNDSMNITIEYQGPHQNPDNLGSGDYCNRATSEVPDPPETPAKIVFKQNNKVYAEYNGLVGGGNLYDGRYTFANGEVWSVKGREVTIVTPSPTKTKNKQVQNDKEAGERKIKIQKLTEFRKKIKAGSEVILRLSGKYGKGVVIKTKNDAAEVQVHFLFINGNETPYTQRVWINKRDLAYSRLAFVD